MFNLRFDHPDFLWLALLAIPLLIIGWRALRLTDGLRRTVILGLRAALWLGLTIMLAGPHRVREHDHLTVIGLLDISGSVQRFGGMDFRLTIDDLRSQGRSPTNELSDHTESSIIGRQSSIIEYLRQWFRTATDVKAPDDRFGLIVFDGKAIAIAAPTKGDYVDDNLDTPIVQGTNIEDAVRLGLAMFPPDTAKRLVLVTDGNETAGNVREAIARLGATDFRSGDAARTPGRSLTNNHPSTIPIDVLPIAYRVTNDVQVARIEAPPSAQPGQTVLLRIVVESTHETSGYLSLRREGEAIDLSPDQPGTARAVRLPAGSSVHLAQVTLGHTPINRFEAVFEAANPMDNILPDNDSAEAFVATPSRGSVLVVDSRALGGGMEQNLLAQMLSAADIPTEVRSPNALPHDLLSMQNYDLIVLDNIAAYEINHHQQDLLARYVHDLGGGLIMAGGDNSFGAGGWKGSPVAAMLPVDVEPSRELRLPTAAIVLVLDRSGSMNQPVAGARMTQQEIANEACALAIESLRAETMVGVITFAHEAHVFIPLQPNEDPARLAQRMRSVTAGGGTHFTPALREAHRMMQTLDAEARNVQTKRVVFISDGVSYDSAYDSVIAAMVADNIQITTIAVGDEADHEALARMASTGGGVFYPVRDPRTLPRVLMDTVQVVNKPLLKEASFTPQVLPTGSTLTLGLDAAPPLEGLVITSARPDPKIWLEMIDPDGEPLLAHWQVGLGRVAAFTSAAPGSGDTTGGLGWARHWMNWPTATSFWVQLVRFIARPAMNQEAELIAVIQDEQLQITYEMSDQAQTVGATYLQVDGVVYQPDGSSMPARLRPTAPGRYETSLDAPLAGNYIVALSPRSGARQLAPAIGGANRTSNPEFRRYVSNLALLEEVVLATGGRRLDIENPLALHLFDRVGMPRSVSSLPAWRNVLWLMLALLLVDAASRRIAWDSHLLRALLVSAVARVTPSRVRGEQSAATLASLRRINLEGDLRRESQSAGLDRLAPTGRVAPPPSREPDLNLHDEVDDIAPEPAPSTQARATVIPTAKKSATPAPPDESRVAAALDALLGRTKTPPKPDGAQPGGARSEPAKAAETTSQLLAAKRRKREQMQSNDER